MDYSAIIKRAWQITWKYKALWVLGLFAGVSGCNSSGGSSYSSGSRGGGDTGSSAMPPMPSTAQIERMVTDILPALIALVVLFFALGIVWSIFSIAARGGLITGVNEVEEGRHPVLSDLWSAGFKRFWTLVGLDIILWLPMALIVIVFVVLIAAPIVAAALAGDKLEPTAMIGPVCGTLAIGFPLLLVASFVLGIMYFLAQRYIMLGGQGALEAAGNSWRFLRARLKDTGLMWLVNAGLNMVASMVMAIPMVGVGVAIGVPIILAITAKSWGAVAGLGVLLLFAVSVVSLAYSAIWGTFTSALWTVFFRQVTGMAPAEATAVVGLPPVAASPYPATPPRPPEGQSEYAPAPPPPMEPPGA